VTSLESPPIDDATAAAPAVDVAPPPADPPGERRGSLHPVLAVIPEAAYERPTWKGLAYLGRDLAVYALAVGLLIAFANPLVVVPVWILASLAISGLFVIGHDAAHGALFESKRLNGIVGRVAMLPSLHVFEGWVLGHNRVHHRFTACQGFDFVWHPTTPAEFAELPRWKQLRHRIEWTWAGAGAYYVREIWWNKMLVGKPPKRFAAPIRRDRILVVAFALVATAGLAALGWAQTGTVAGAAWMVTRVLVVPFLGFSFVIGSLVHVHHIAPDIRWWPRKQWTKFAGQVEATTILATPAWLDLFFHSIMVHVPHHVDQRIPMYNLELAAEAICEHFPEARGGPLRFRDFVANTRACKLYDFETGTWHRYAEAARPTPAVAA
jgi:omega-6 fatty acid desaturase (delta-12 desaturase)